MKSAKKLLCVSLIIVFLVSMTMITVTSASPATSLYVDPPAVSFPDEVFQISINVDDAPTTYAWEVYLSWDSNLLALVNVAEGDFLHRWDENPLTGEVTPMFSTAFAYTPLGEANLNGEIIIACSLVGNVPWANGDGLLVTIDFLVKSEGSGAINLFNTRLWDHTDAEGYPAPTNYNNVEVSVETSAPFYSVDLAKWKLKVNGKAGIAGEGGHRTTVGTKNLLEASVKNYGPRDVYVQVYFEIRDSAGVWIATVWSDIVGPLSPGERAILSATWTAPHPRVYYITANLFYPILGGFSRTLRLDAFW